MLFILNTGLACQDSKAKATDWYMYPQRRQDVFHLNVQVRGILLLRTFTTPGRRNESSENATSITRDPDCLGLHASQSALF